MGHKLTQCVRDVLGPWQEVGFDSGLIRRCRRYWEVPVAELPDEVLATYLRQRIAVVLMAAEARRRIEASLFDGSELYPGELVRSLGEVA